MMERFFFTIEYGERSEDREGTLLPSCAAARAAAVHLLGELLRDEGDRFWAKPDISVTVTDAAGLVLWSVMAEGSEFPAASASRHR